MANTGALGPARRVAALDRLASDSFDVVVVGGGITGAGCALDAATRGLRVALVEQRDWAAGTSSRSSKLIHGGLRYLEQLELHLVWEALRERGLLTTFLAPHLVEPVSFLYPLRHRIWERAYVGAGVGLYDMLAALSGRRWRRHRHLSRRRALSRFPGLNDDRLAGAIEYWDGRVDDARYTVTLVRTAVAHGAVAVSSMRVLDLLRAGARVRGVRTRCLETGRNLEVAAAAVINATGVWTDDIEDMAGARGLQVQASKGIHILVPRDRIRGDTGLIIRTATSVLFVIPWFDHWIIGTTDTPWRLDKAHPAASRTDIDYVLQTVNQVLAEPVTPDDIIGVYAGLRPLLSGEAEHTSRLSREHAVIEAAPGLTTVAGGKLTTYRIMAADAVDTATRQMSPRPMLSATAAVPLLGATGFEALWARRAALGTGLDGGAVERLLRRYGSLVDEVLAPAAEDEAWLEPVVADAPYLKAEIRYAVTHEGALHLDDVLTRRTRLSIETPDRGTAAAPEVAAIMGDILGWDRAAVARELDHYRRRVEAERESQRMPDDRTADAARLGAPDVRMGAQGL